MAKSKIILTNNESSLNPDSRELANIIVDRLGLVPRKKGSTKEMYLILIELYEKAKNSSKNKDEKLAVMTVEEMAETAKITRQTMYDYLKRWLDLKLIEKQSFMQFGKVIVGYSLTGNSLENAFTKTKSSIIENLEGTQNYIKELQKELKNDKLRKKN